MILIRERLWYPLTEYFLTWIQNYLLSQDEVNLSCPNVRALHTYPSLQGAFLTDCREILESRPNSTVNFCVIIRAGCISFGGSEKETSIYDT